MKLKELVCSLEPSKELEKLGMNQDSYFWWYHKRGQRWHIIDNLSADRFLEDAISVSAPIFAELLEVLPDRITTIISKTYSVEKNYFLFITKTKKTKWFVLPDYYIGYKTLDDIYLHSERADTMVDATAKMIIYLIKERIIGVNKK